MKKAILSALILFFHLTLGAEAFAGDGSGTSNTFQIRRHEFAICGSFLPGNYLIPRLYGQENYFYSDDIVGRTNAWWASYTYNVTKVLTPGI